MNRNWLELFSRHGTEIPAVIILLLAAVGVGTIIRHGVQRQKDPAGIPAACAIGLCLLMLLGVLTGIIGFNPPDWLLWSAGTIAAIPSVTAYQWKNLRLASWPYWILVIIAILTFAPAACPPVGWDELTYHLALPLRWLRDGGLPVYTDLPYSAFPAGPEILFRHLINIGGIHTPRLLTWALNCILLFWVYHYLSRRLTSGNALGITLALLAAPVWLMVQREAFVEIFILLNVMAIIDLTTEESADLNATSRLLSLGLLTGGCAAVKLYGLAAAGAALIPLIQNTVKRRNYRSLAILAAIAVLTLLPFYMRAWQATGNPCYPYYASLLNGSRIDRMVSDWHHAAAAQQYGQLEWYGIAEALFLIAAPGKWFDGSLGWQWLLLLAAALTALWYSRHWLLVWGIAALLYYLCWYGMMPQARFLLPLPLLLLPLWRELPEKTLCRRWLCPGLLILTAISIPDAARQHYVNCWRYLTDKQIKTVDFIYSATGADYLPAVDMANRLIPPGSKSLLLFDHRTAYFPAGTELATPFVQGKYFTPPPSAAADLLRVCHEQQIQYVIVVLSAHHPDRVARYFVPALALTGQLEELNREGKVTSLWSGVGSVIYRINPRP